MISTWAVDASEALFLGGEFDGSVLGQGLNAVVEWGYVARLGAWE